MSFLNIFEEGLRLAEGANFSKSFFCLPLETISHGL